MEAHQRAELYLKQCEQATAHFLDSIRQQSKDNSPQSYADYVHALMNIAGKPVWEWIQEADVSMIVKAVRDPKGRCIVKGK